MANEYPSPWERFTQNMQRFRENAAKLRTAGDISPERQQEIANQFQNNLDRFQVNVGLKPAPPIESVVAPPPAPSSMPAVPFAPAIMAATRTPPLQATDPSSAAHAPQWSVADALMIRQQQALDQTRQALAADEARYQQGRANMVPWGAPATQAVATQPMSPVAQQAIDAYGGSQFGRRPGPMNVPLFAGASEAVSPSDFRTGPRLGTEGLGPLPNYRAIQEQERLATIEQRKNFMEQQMLKYIDAVSRGDTTTAQQLAYADGKPNQLSDSERKEAKETYAAARQRKKARRDANRERMQLVKAGASVPWAQAYMKQRSGGQLSQAETDLLEGGRGRELETVRQVNAMNAIGDIAASMAKAQATPDAIQQAIASFVNAMKSVPFAVAGTTPEQEPMEDVTKIVYTGPPSDQRAMTYNPALEDRRYAPFYRPNGMADLANWPLRASR